MFLDIEYKHSFLDFFRGRGCVFFGAFWDLASPPGV